MKIELSLKELNIIFSWIEEATGGFFATSDKFVTIEEDKLIKKFEKLKAVLEEEKKKEVKTIQ